MSPVFARWLCWGGPAQHGLVRPAFTLRGETEPNRSEQTLVWTHNNKSKILPGRPISKKDNSLNNRSKLFKAVSATVYYRTISMVFLIDFAAWMLLDAAIMHMAVWRFKGFNKIWKIYSSVFSWTFAIILFLFSSFPHRFSPFFPLHTFLPAAVRE